MKINFTEVVKRINTIELATHECLDLRYSLDILPGGGTINEKARPNGTALLKQLRKELR